jgi:hypothetical protein
MVWEQSFFGLDNENPCHHLQETRNSKVEIVYLLCHGERAKQWYAHAIGSTNGDWDKLKNKFCLAFFPMSHIVSLPKEILDFEQFEKESIGPA